MITIFDKILEMSMMGCYCMLVVGLVRLLLKQYGRKYTYWLWFVVFVNLCVPLYVEASFSLVPQKLSEISFAKEPEVVDAAGQDGTVNIGEQEDILPVTSAEIVKEYPEVVQGNSALTHKGAVANGLENDSSAELMDSTYGGKVNEKNVKELLCGVWLLGIAVFGLWNFLHMLQFRRNLVSAKSIAVDEEQGILYMEGIATPFLYGFVKPVIYLPADLAEEERDYIIAHEKYHRKRRDYIVKPIVFGIVLLHWFNPFVWLAYFLFIRDMEFSCDEAVLADAKAEVRKQYAGSLLKCAARQNGYVLNMLTFGEPTVKSRIQNILQYKKRSVMVSALVMFCVVAVSVGLLVRQEQSGEIVESESTNAQDESAAENAERINAADNSEMAGESGPEEQVQATDTAFTWEYGEMASEVGRTIYVDRLLSSNKVYAKNGGASAYVTFADEGAEVAYVLAGEETMEGICGSLWKVPMNGSAILLKQQIIVADKQLQYVTVDGVKYLVLNYWENEQLSGKVLPFTEYNAEELVPHLHGGKVIGADGSIQCLAPSYTSCSAAVNSEEMTYVWTAGEPLAYDFRYLGDGRIRAVSAKEISFEELNTLPYGENLHKQVEEHYPAGNVQYILRENGRLDVNIFAREEQQAKFYYMCFQVEEEGSTAVLQESGEGVYLVSMTGTPALEAFLKAFAGEKQHLSTEIAQLPWGEEAAFTRAWDNRDLGEQGQSYIYGTEYELTEAERDIMQGLLLDCSENWADRPTLTENNSNAVWNTEWNEANKKIYVIQKTEGFVAYARYFESSMLVQTPDEKYVLIDEYFTSNYGVQPQALEQDFDGDGSNELAIIGLTEHGTGVCVDYLYMVDKDSDGKWYVYRVMHEWYEEQLTAHIDSSYAVEGLELLFNGVPQGYHAYVQGDEASRHYAGSQIDFYFEGEKIICRADLMIYSDTQFMGLSDGSQLYMELAYLGEGKWTEVSCKYGVDENARTWLEEWKKQNREAAEETR